MFKTTRKENKLGHDEPDPLIIFKKISRLLEILVRLNLHNIKGDQSQNDMISLLDSLKCTQSEIADFLGTTPNTVNVSLYKAKRRLGRR